MRPVALYRWIIPSYRPGNGVQEAERPVQDWALVQFPDLPGAQLSAPRPLCAYGLGLARLMTSKTYPNSQLTR